MLNLNPPYSFALNRTHKMTHEIFGQVPGSRVSWASEIMFFSGQHGAPTLDAIGHIGRDLKLYGGVDAVAATATPGGIGANLGIDHFPLDLMLNRVGGPRRGPAARRRPARPAGAGLRDHRARIWTPRPRRRAWRCDRATRC